MATRAGTAAGRGRADGLALVGLAGEPLTGISVAEADGVVRVI
jgi:hypothetical protein